MDVILNACYYEEDRGGVQLLSHTNGSLTFFLDQVASIEPVASKQMYCVIFHNFE